MIVQTEGIVLKTFDLRETSRIAVFFTKDHGRVSGVLKGIRKDPRKFGSSVDRFSVNDIVYYQYRNSDLHLIGQCDMRNYFFPIRQDLRKSMAAQYVLELIYLIMPPEEKNEDIYALMLDFLGELQTTEDVNRLIHAFQIKTLLYSGFRPHLDACLRCRKEVTGPARFSLKDGGLICSRCPMDDTTVHLIAPATVASILFIERNPWSSCLRLQISGAVREELKYVINHFLVFHLGKKVKTAQYLS
ncbi:MAG: DNA repair protein RecO [Candidatus Omnitrophota bacterium]|nr:DNA repair protein RecO [Candidatus Omnitrophota bacterium]MDZ4241811.1 DNA repair protein RecO [Candidatus Omnitrophota bacterium]